ncbi:hypothetical protein GCM10012319_40470 [Comamonas sp. KCTC 72670]|nr:hypothetical protein GCM10012319_40470 [Comamonas sp. KCTC 72670]
MSFGIFTDAFGLLLVPYKDECLTLPASNRLSQQVLGVGLLLPYFGLASFRRKNNADLRRIFWLSSKTNGLLVGLVDGMI